MKLVKWLSPSHSNRSGSALIKVEAGEVADIERIFPFHNVLRTIDVSRSSRSSSDFSDLNRRGRNPLISW